MQTPTLISPAQLTGIRTTGLSSVSQGASGTSNVDLLVRGRLGTRAHRLLGIDAVGQARLGQAQRPLTSAFGGDVASWQQVGTPWIAARSLARQRETLASHSTVGWLLAAQNGTPRRTV